MMATTSAYKPSPLSFGSPGRASPFRRPESPAASPSTAIRSQTPPPFSPSRPATAIQTSPSRQSVAPPANGTYASTRFGTPAREPPTSPTKGSSSGSLAGNNGKSSPVMKAQGTIMGPNGDVLSKLQPAQLRELRESFQVLDRDSDGTIGRDDIVDMLKNLGQPSDVASVSRFFPPGAQQTVNLPTFLNTLAKLLSPLSPPAELMSAFEAFDDDDNGEVDLTELKDALLHTSPDQFEGGRMLNESEVDRVLSGFCGRKTFGKSSRNNGLGGKKEVFRYQEFVANINGGGNQTEKEGKK